MKSSFLRISAADAFKREKIANAFKALFGTQ